MTASAAPARETASLWAGLRIVVLDTETTGSVTGDRVLSIGAVSVIDGTISDPWSAYCNPHCAITPGSQRKHHLTEEFLADKPDFADSADDLLAYLEPRTEGEQVVVCGHNPGFDVARLRSELIRVGADLPTLRVLDTRATTKAVGLDVPDGSLESLLRVVKITNAKPHDALCDATATAEALVKLVAMAVDRRVRTLGGLGSDTSRLTTKVRPAKIKDTRFDGPSEYDDPAFATAHLDRHKFAPSGWDVWLGVLDECTTLACGGLPPRVASAARLRPADTLAAVRNRLDARLVEPNRRDSAVLVAGLADVVTTIGDLDIALDVYRAYAPRLAGLPACPRRDFDAACRYCREGNPCPQDVWHHAVGAVLATRGGPALLDPDNPAGGLVAAVRAEGLEELAGWLAWTAGDAATDPTIGARVWATAWDLGLRDPRIADGLVQPLAVAGTRAGPLGRVALAEAIAVCDDALATRAGSSDPGWLLVTSRSRQLRAVLDRLDRQDQGAGLAPITTADGRRHEAKRDRKQHPMRFRVGG